MIHYNYNATRYKKCNNVSLLNDKDVKTIERKKEGKKTNNHHRSSIVKLILYNLNSNQMINRDAKKETITVTNVSHELKKKRRKILCRWMEQRIARGIRIFLFEARSETRHLNVSKGPEDYIVSGSVSRWKENESWNRAIRSGSGEFITIAVEGSLRRRRLQDKNLSFFWYRFILSKILSFHLCIINLKFYFI